MLLVWSVKHPAPHTPTTVHASHHCSHFNTSPGQLAWPKESFFTPVLPHGLTARWSCEMSCQFLNIFSSKNLFRQHAETPACWHCQRPNSARKSCQDSLELGQRPPRSGLPSCPSCEEALWRRQPAHLPQLLLCRAEESCALRGNPSTAWNCYRVKWHGKGTVVLPAIVLSMKKTETKHKWK